ncbi:hypothetical protein KY290_003956 [Solanum tuberosum]|uniref:Conserved oligomeric Golgi complex subunit 8 n=1 Tax=Solanum tuberosum TaxID=4113 RepID=A0ABQ7WUB9_SOLTU|nr:hypothetical protein KY290_003956 [Solanum tuberosum]
MHPKLPVIQALAAEVRQTTQSLLSQLLQRLRSNIEYRAIFVDDTSRREENYDGRLLFSWAIHQISSHLRTLKLMLPKITQGGSLSNILNQCMDNDVKCDDFGFSFEKTGILVHKMIKEVPSISVLKLCKVSLKGLYEEIRQVRLSPICFNKLKSLKLKLGVDEDHMQVMIQLLKYSPNLEVLKLWCDEDGEWRENSLMYYDWCEFWPAREDQGRGHEVFHPTPLGKKLQCTYKMHDPEESIVCLDSHLKSIQLIGFKDEENEIELLRFFLKNARVLEKLTIVWAGYALKSEEALKKVLNIPRTSSQVLLTFRDAKLKRKSTNWLDYC